MSVDYILLYLNIIISNKSIIIVLNQKWYSIKLTDYFSYCYCLLSLSHFKVKELNIIQKLS